MSVWVRPVGTLRLPTIASTSSTSRREGSAAFTSITAFSSLQIWRKPSGLSAMSRDSLV
jgi:hypothetical protein